MTFLQRSGVELPSWLPSSKLESTIKERIALHQKLFDRLTRVVDVPSAASASQEVNENFRQITANLRQIKVMKATQNEVDRLKKYIPDQDQIAQKVLSEIRRIVTIDGAFEALDILAAAQELEVEENEVKRMNQMQNPGAPITTPPPVPPPFNPPKLPQNQRGPGPNRGRMPGGGPGFGR